jgi:putative ABC transport system permease protein
MAWAAGGPGAAAAGAAVGGAVGIAAFHRLVGQVMGHEPYRSARRVFLITDNGSCHRGRRAADRLRTRWSNIVLVHTPVHASWLNQIGCVVRREAGEQIPLGPYRDLHTVVGLTTGMVTSAGDPVAWVTLLDAQGLQFEVPPALQRREHAAGRSPVTTADINAVLVTLYPGVSTAGVAQEIERWKHLSAVTEQQQEDYLTQFIIEKMQRQLGMFMGILIAVSAVIIALIIYTLTMVRSIATLKLIGAPDRTIIGLIVQQALVLGVAGFLLGTALISLIKDHFPRRVQMETRDLVILFCIVVVVCLLGSMLGVRAAVRVDPAKALASG